MAEEVRRRGFAGAVTLIGDEPGLPYDRPPLSKQLLAGQWETDRLLLRPSEQWDALGVTHLPGTAAVGLDTEKSRVVLADGTACDYDALVITTGRVFAVNATAPMLVARAAHPHLVRSGGGVIVNVSFIAGLRGFSTGAYGASKGALQAMTVDLAHTWGPDNIRVNCLVPGHLYTPMGDQGGTEGRALRRKANLLGLEGTAWDLAWAALFMTSPESRWITGTVLPIDAGTTTATGLGMLSRLTTPENNGEES